MTMLPPSPARSPRTSATTATTAIATTATSTTSTVTSASATPAAARLWRLLDAVAAGRAVWCLPLLFGVMSLVLGQDDNWDLRNYHLYAPFALMNGKIGYDLAPGQWQSYFNPTLDLLYYGLTRALPAPLAGFLMGALHGVNALLVLAIGRQLLAQPPHAAPPRLPLLLALAGCMGCAFFSQLGNTMGDNMTALCVLGALLMVLRHWPALAAARGRGLALALLAGLLMGAGTGLKLTNATYALALCLALLTLPGGLARALPRSLMFGLGVLTGIAATAGHWYWRMWSQFGNPLFPQFNDIFHAPLAAPIGIGDTHWLPRGWVEHVLWPFIFALQPERVTEIRMRLVLWPLLYIAFALLALAAWPARRPLPAQALAPVPPALSRPACTVLTFFALSYLGWQLLFSIYRYLVPLELLAPLVLWLLAHRLLAPSLAGRAAGAVLVLAVLLALPTPHWGRARWSGEAFRVDTPAMAHPGQSLVVTTEAPVGWYTAGFTPALAFVSISGGFQGSAAYDSRLASMLAARRGPFYVLLTSNAPDPGQPPVAARQLAGQAADAATRIAAVPMLARHGLRLDPAAGCQVYAAYIGRNYLPYQLCVIVADRNATPPGR